MDEAQPADAIVVFGAAQYNGAPSPVFKARLDHGFELEERGLAALIITTGGRGGDRRFTEAGVGRDYLVQRGVAAERILTETRSETTLESVRDVARILHVRQMKTCVAVSDGFHLFRIKRLFSSQAITAFGSPDPRSPIEADSFQSFLHSLREAAILTRWYLGFRE